VHIIEKSIELTRCEFLCCLLCVFILLFTGFPTHQFSSIFYRTYSTLRSAVCALNSKAGAGLSCNLLKKSIKLARYEFLCSLLCVYILLFM